MPAFDATPLFAPIRAGGLALRNRIVMAPMTRARSSIDGVPPPYAAIYYAQRASAGLIVSEATNISPQAKGHEGTPGIWDARQIDAWRGVTDAVHAAEGTIVLQLWHPGRIARPDNGSPVSSSAVRAEDGDPTAPGPNEFPMPRTLETAEVLGVVNDYRHAAHCAREARFDGIEIQAANNALPDQFVRDSVNRRTDAYGGSVDNRLRFPLEVAAAVTQVWDANRVGLRLSPVTTVPGNTPLDGNVMATYGTYVSALDNLGLAYIHMIEGTTQGPRTYPRHIDLNALRRRFRGVWIANNGYSTQQAAEAVRSHRVDMVSFARLYLSNPDLVDRIRRYLPLEPIPPREMWYGGGEKGYTDWPPAQKGSA